MRKNKINREDDTFNGDALSREKEAFALASIEKAGEAIFWVDKNARFVEVNEAGCRHLGYDKNEILSLKVFDINPYFPKQRWKDFWKELREKKSISFEVLHRHKSGRLFPAELRLNYIKIGNKEYNFAFATDITDRRRTENVMSDLSHGLYAAVGEDYFISVVKYLSRFLRADYAYVAEFVGDNRLHAKTLALCTQGNLIDNLEVDLEGTPCKTVVGEEICSYPSGVQERFPEAHMMASLAVQAYFGASLNDSKGAPLGLLTVMYRHPVEETEMIKSVLKIFASRTSAELERRRTENSLIESEARYRDVIENSFMGISVYDRSGRCILTNKALVDSIGGTKEQVLASNFYKIKSWKKSGLLDAAKKALETGMKERRTIHVETSFGKELWLKSVFVPYSEKGEKRLMHLVEDVTAQKKAEERLDRAIQGSNDGLWDLDLKNNVLWVSPRFEAMLGYDEGELTDPFEVWKMSLHPDDKEFAIKRMHAHLEKRATYDIEYRLKKKTGDYAWFRSRGEALRDDEGSPVRFSGSIQDITERKLAEHQLKLSKYSIDNARESIFLIDSRGRFINANKAACLNLGYSLDDLKGMRVSDIDTYFSEERWDDYWNQLKKRGSLALESMYKKKDGTQFHVEIKVNYIKYDNQEYDFAFATDITERKRAEEELRRAHDELETRVVERTVELQKTNEALNLVIERHKESEKNLIENEIKYRNLSHEFHTLLDSIPDRLILLSPDLTILWSNRAFDLDLGKQRDKDTAFCYRMCFNRSGPCQNCPVVKSFQSCKEESAQITDPDGRVFDKRAFPLLDEAGRVGTVIELSRDITARIKMEEEAKLVQSRLIHTNKMTSLGMLVAGVAHEINNPNSYIMTNIEMFTQIWEDAVELLQKNEQQNVVLGGIPFEDLVRLGPQLINGIHEGSVRIKEIIQRLITFGKPDRSALDGTVNIEKTVQSAAAMLDNYIKKLTERFSIHCERNIPPVRGSAQQVEQVIINLIMNALQSLPDRKSGIWITCCVDEKDETAVISVRDEGVGIPENILHNITDPFFTTRSDEGGTGLGLSISHAIIKDHKGTLQFETTEGAGTTVTVKLPVKRNGS